MSESGGPKKVRILHVVNSLGIGGLENGLVNLIHWLDPERFEHVVCAVSELGPMRDRLPAGVPVVCLAQRQSNGNGRRRFRMTSLAQLIRDLKPAIVHSRNWGAMEAIFAGRWARSCAVIHSEHGIELHTAAREPWRRRAFRRLAFEMADRVFCVSDALRNLHAERTGFPARRIGVLHNGVDDRRFRPDLDARVRWRTQLGIANSEFCVGCVGRLDPIKDLPTVFQALDGLAQAHPLCRLLVVGDGPERRRLEQIVSTRPRLARQVRFLGTLREIPEILNAFDAYVLASISEGISNTLLEAMASGLAVVASDTGGNPEIVEHDRSGLLFPVGNVQALAAALARLREEPNLRLRLGKGALERIRERFSQTRMIHRYERLYLETAGGLNELSG